MTNVLLLLLVSCYFVQDSHVTRDIEGWQLHVHRDLLKTNSKETTKAIELLGKQLREIKRVVPASAVKQLQQVPLWFSPPYPGVGPKAEYHPGAGWLKDNGRNEAMVKSIEFTNIAIFEEETRRMPNFALHELSHAYHDRVLEGGFDNAEVLQAYQRAKAGGKYERVERQDASGRKTQDRAYALTNPQEYFAETTEAYFTRNDFYPYVRKELQAHDPASVEMLKKMWGVK